MDHVLPRTGRHKLKPLKDIAFKVIELFREGKQYLEIGKELNMSKGSVASFIRRAREHDLLDDMPPRSQIKKSEVVVAIAPPKKPIPERTTPFRPPVEKLKRIRLSLVDHKTAVSFEELEPHHCKWPSGDPKRPDFRFCGRRRELGSPYCQEHTAGAFQRHHR